MIIILVELVIARFMVNIQHDKDERRDADTQAEDVDERGNFISPKYP